MAIILKLWKELWSEPETDRVLCSFMFLLKKEEDTNQLCEEIAALYPDMDVEVHYGGQPLYYYLLSAE